MELKSRNPRKKGKREYHKPEVPLMATVKVKFTAIKVGDVFFADGGNGYEQYKKISDLEYESVQNNILGSFYAAPGFLVEVPEVPAAKPAKKSAKK